MNPFGRTNMRRKGWDYAGPGCYFVTVCTEGRRELLGRFEKGRMRPSVAGRIMAEEWQRTAEMRPEVRLDRWVVMPDHIQGILFIHPDDRQDLATKQVSLGWIVGQFKSACARRIAQAGVPDFAWQRGFHDRIIRSRKQLHHNRKYVGNNPDEWVQSKGNAPSHSAPRNPKERPQYDTPHSSTPRSSRSP